MNPIRATLMKFVSLLAAQCLLLPMVQGQWVGGKPIPDDVNGRTFVALPDGQGVSALFIGTNFGVYTSTNSGALWQPTSLGAGTAGNWDFAVFGLSSSNDTLLAVSFWKVYVEGTNACVYLSSDRGRTWSSGQMIPLETLGEEEYSHAITQTGIVLTDGVRGVIRSTDQGKTWGWINNGLTDLRVTALVASGSNVYAGSPSGFFRSTNNGQDWVASDSGLADSSVLSLTMLGTKVIAGTTQGIYQSLDGGITWSLIQNAISGFSVPIVTGWTSSTGVKYLAAATSATVYFSTNEGTTWTASSDPTFLPPEGIGGLFPDPSDPTGKTLFLTNRVPNSCVCRTTDLGATWKRRDIGLSTCFPKAPMVVLDNDVFVNASGLIHSSDGGVHWENVSTGSAYPSSIGLAGSGQFLFSSSPEGLYRSTNRGRDWSLISNISIGSLFVVGSALFCGNSTALFRSADNGVTWVSVNQGLDGEVSAFAVSPTATDTVLIAGAGYSIFRSTDGGNSWQKKIDLWPMYISAFAVLGDWVFAGTSGNGIYASSDRGMTWFKRGLGSTKVSDLMSSGSYLFAATGDILSSSDSGATWNSVSQGLPFTEGGPSNVVQTLAACGSNLLIGCRNDGIWRRPLSEITPDMKPLNASDIFPLAAGNTWTYNFSRNVFGNGSWHVDTGAVEYRIVSASVATDSTLWHVVAKRAFTRLSVSGGFGPYRTIYNDTLYFDIIELKTDAHQLYTYPSYPEEAFLFMRTEIDSTWLFHRYQVTSAGTAAWNRPGGQFEWNFSMTLGQNTGPLTSSGLRNDGGTLWQKNFSLAAFSTTRIHGAELVLPDRVELASAFGVAGDTSIVVSNPGIDTLKIASIVSSDPLLSARITPSVIPPFSGAVLSLHYFSQIAQTTDARIAIASNGLSSPDSIAVAITIHVGPNAAFALEQNYPNPFNPGTTISYTIASPTHAALTVYDVLGRRVALLVDESKLPGHYEVKFDGSNLASGVYFIRLQAGSFEKTMRSMLLR